MKKEQKLDVGLCSFALFLGLGVKKNRIIGYFSLH